MNRLLALAVALVSIPAAQATNIAAGKALASRVCAACHGEAGVSVADSIPNLGGQRAQYLEIQLKALKDGARRNGIMNPIAGQLSLAQISDLAAYYSSQSGAGSTTTSDFMPTIARTGVKFPQNHRATFVKYHAANFPELEQVRHYYANPVALRAAKFSGRLPAGSVLMSEVYSVKRDEKLDLAKGADGIYVANRLQYYSVMERGEGWGRDIPPILRNEDWNYAAFLPDGQPRPRINHAECLACHKSQDVANYAFTMKELSDAAKVR